MTDLDTPRSGRTAADLDAASTEAAPASPADVALMEEMEEALKDVVDPELGVNIVDLGLVYDVRVDREVRAGDGVDTVSPTGEVTVATIDMTLTSAACPLTDMIEDQVAAALVGDPDGALVDDFRINWVWLPPWGPERITEDGREQMRALGFNI
ncbi:metal-sulfur cluster assembly factor [Nakamurella flava]|uniref:Metal-sulfur cluster assembly factor n=1 Tax=Nakamurella flava TaxID=2576308 RepID=A0A4U6QJT9_9ACTN|nr:metal-sulfur cluster assembly factor [Nakamurella flava]